MIALVDYKLSNLNGVLSAVSYLGFNAKITNDKDIIKNAYKIILPGVGAFGDAINNLNELDLIDVLEQQVIKNKIPFLGICVGAQLICKDSDEFGFHKGLNWINANVERIKTNDKNLILPHTGWNDIKVINNSILMSGIEENQDLFYYNHSHAIYALDNKDVIASCDYGSEFASIIQKDNIYATQFHPEKSQKSGLKLLENFLKI